MRLAIISTEFPPGPGGIGNHSLALAKGLREIGAKVTVICPKDYSEHDTVKSFDASQSYGIVRWPSSNYMAFQIILRVILTLRKCMELKPDCMICSGSRGVLYGMVVAFLLRVPYVAVGHGDEFYVFSGIYGRILKAAFNKSKKVVCVSEFTKNIAVKFGVHNDIVKIIYNGADADTYKPNMETSPLRKKLNLEGKKIVLTVGNVTEKAQDVVIKAMPKVLEFCPDAFYLIVGFPTLKNSYEALAEDLGISEYVYFTGTVPQSDLCQYYNLCDVFVLNSRVTREGQTEGFGIVLVEAGLCGKPVVGTRGCGIEEVITEGHTGFLVEPDSPTQTANAIKALLQDTDMASSMGKKGRQKALSTFTWKRFAQEFHETILSCI